MIAEIQEYEIHRDVGLDPRIPDSFWQERTGFSVYSQGYVNAANMTRWFRPFRGLLGNRYSDGKTVLLGECFYCEYMDTLASESTTFYMICESSKMVITFTGVKWEEVHHHSSTSACSGRAEFTFDSVTIEDMQVAIPDEPIYVHHQEGV